MRVNVRGTWLVTRALAPLIAEGGQGPHRQPRLRHRAVGRAAAARLRGQQGRGDLDDPLAGARARAARHRRHGGRARHHALRGDRVRAGRAPSALRNRPRGAGPAGARRTSSTPSCSCSRRARWRSPVRCCRSMRGSCSHERDHARHGRRPLLPGARRGAGTPVVLLHGIGSNARSFVPLIEALDPRFSVLAWDAPGYGDSHAADGRVAGCLRLCGGAEPAAGRTRHLALHSGRAFARRADRRAALRWCSPNRVATLCLISPALGYGAERSGAAAAGGGAAGSTNSTGWGRDISRPQRAPGLLADPSATARRPAAGRARDGGGSPSGLRPGGAHAGGRPPARGRRADRRPDRGLGRRAGPHHAARERAPGVRGPAASQRGAAYGEIPDAGHAVCQEQPVEVARAILSIVDNKASAHA